MGKRKLHGQSYYQCDWTGFPMRNPNCWMPAWTDEGKLIKKGSYCNWESVLAHAKHLATEEYQRTEDYIRTQTGDCTLNEAPHFTDVEHFKGNEHSKSLTAEEYHRECCYQSDEVYGVKIQEGGHHHELLMDTTDGKLDYTKHLKRPALCADTQPSCFQSYRKGGKREKELCVFYYPGKNGLELNALASQLLKMQIHGEVLLVQCTKEPSFMPRERFVHYMLTDFNDNYMRKRKRHKEQSSVSAEEYTTLKAEMHASLSEYEKQASASALAPPELVKLRKQAPIDGKQLAKLERHRREQPPPSGCA
jgi:hypothetical protein